MKKSIPIGVLFVWAGTSSGMKGIVMIDQASLESNAAQVMIDLVQREINNGFASIEAISRDLHEEYKSKYGESGIVLKYGDIVDKYLRDYREAIKSKVISKNIFMQLKEMMFIDLFLYIDPDLEMPKSISKKKIYQYAKSVAKQHFMNKGYEVRDL